ncbi:MAG: hypothetical protein ACKVQS_08455 [Fimbriimonadaceae bacterium]
MDAKDLGTVNSDLMTGRYGGAGASAAWKSVMDLYYLDRMPEAYQFALSLGAGDLAFGTRIYRMVEAEFRAREYGEIRELGDILRIEGPKGMPIEGWEFFESAVREEFAAVCQRLGYEPVEKVLVSLMIPESDAPWTPYRHGFCVDKEPYEKVCLPLGLMGDERQFRSALRHEFAHVVNLNLAQGQMGSWMEEAIAMRMGDEFDARYLNQLRQGAPIWMAPRELSDTFSGDRRGEVRESVWWAYQQAGVIGRYLSEIKGERALGDLARGFANNSVLLDIKMRLLGQSAEDEALREVFGKSEKEVYLAALEWAKGQ